MLRSAGALFVVIAVLASAAIARAQAEPDLATVLANVRAARGTAPVDEVTVTAFTRHGLSGTETRLRAGSDFRIDTMLGPIHTASGSVAGVAWRQNANGETVTNAEAAAEPADEAFPTTLAHVHEPADLFVIERLSRFGRGTKDYVDPATWRIVRFERITATETTTTTYDDFRTTAGYTQAWHRVVSDGHPENDATYTIVKDDAEPVSPEMLAIPKTRASIVTFPAGQSSVDLPARLTQHFDKFIVRVTIDGRGLDFLVDTGAGAIVLQRDVAQSLGLREFGTYSSAANAGRYVGTTAIVPAMAIGGLTMHDVVVSTIPHVPEQGDGYKIVGLLGFDFLDAIGAKLDYAKGTLTAYDPNTFVAPSAPHTIALDVRLGSLAPRVAVTINGATGTRFTIDTGGIGALVIDDYFRRRYPAAVVDDRAAPDTRRIAGVGGEIDAQFIEIAQLTIGGAEFDHSDAYVLTSPAQYGSAEDGIVGPDLLRLFTVYLDYPHGKIYLVPES